MIGRSFIRALVVVLLPFCGFPLQEAGAQDQDAHRIILADKFHDELDRLAGELPGILGLEVLDLTNGDRFGVNADLVFPQASAIKIPILVELFRQASEGRLRVEEQLTIEGESIVGGGYLGHFKPGTSAMSLHDLAILMIIRSDNSATNLLIDRVGMENVTRTMGELGLPSIRLQRMMIRPDMSAIGRENIATPSDATTLMERIYRCDLPMTRPFCEEMQAILDIPHAGPIQDGIPDGIRVGQKTGTLTGVRVNWGYVDLPCRPFALVVMGNYSESVIVGEVIQEVTEASYEYFRRLAGATDYGVRVRPELSRDSETKC